MSTSEARIRANQQNAAKSTGPKTPEGKERSKQNGLKHGLAGQGVVMPAADFVEVQSREKTLQTEMSPRTALGAILVRQLAMLSVRMERGAQQEFAAVAERSRYATEIYDQERVDAAEALFDQLADDPRRNLQRLRKTPEGIERMLMSWFELRSDLLKTDPSVWSAVHHKKLVNLLGLTSESDVGVRLVALTRATWGNFGYLEPADGAGMEPLERQAWARAILLKQIDAGIAELEADLASMNHENREQSRAEAADRSLFDPSREATLARRYESEARRAFFKSLNEFRKVESEVVEVEKSAEESTKTAELASSRESEGVVEKASQPRANPPARPESFESNRASKTVADAQTSRKVKARELASAA